MLLIDCLMVFFPLVSQVLVQTNTLLAILQRTVLHDFSKTEAGSCAMTSAIVKDALGPNVTVSVIFFYLFQMIL